MISLYALPIDGHDIISISITDRRELSLPRLGFLALQDLETGAHMVVDTSSTTVREAYAQRRAAAVERRRQLFRTLGINAIEVRTDEPYIHPSCGSFDNGSDAGETMLSASSFQLSGPGAYAPAARYRSWDVAVCRTSPASPSAPRSLWNNTKTSDRTPHLTTDRQNLGLTETFKLHSDHYSAARGAPNTTEVTETLGPFEVVQQRTTGR